MILSASRVKQFFDCSWLFYQTYFLKVPENTHPKTKLGSLVHSILESLCKERHRHHYDQVILHQTVYGCPPLARMVKMFRAKNPDVTDEIIAELDKLVFVALNHDFLCRNAKEVLSPEHEFKIDFGDFEIKGFMDRVVIYDNIAVIRDYKTQGKRFTTEQIEADIQAWFYQTAIKHQFGLPARVEFLLLRFPPSKKDPTRYIQSVEPLTDEQIEGFKVCLKYTNDAINELTEESAKSNLKAKWDEGFCERVCSLRKPMDYWVLLEGDKILKGAKSRDELEIKENQRIERRRYDGCPHFRAKNVPLMQPFKFKGGLS